VTGRVVDAVSLDWMAIVDGRDLEVSLALQVQMDHPVEKAVQVHQV